MSTLCAKTILETALELDPGNARSNHYYSQLLSGLGEFDLAFQYADKAVALASDADTRNFVMTNAGRPRYMAGQYDWVLTRYLASTPDAPLAHFYRSPRSGPRACSRKHSTKRRPFRRLTAVVMQEVSA